MSKADKSESEQFSVVDVPSGFRKLIISSFIIIFLTVQIFFGVRSLLTDEKRFGWGMFAYPTFYKLRFYGIKEDGSEERIKSQEYWHLVRKKTYRKLRQRKKFLVYWYGEAALLQMLNGFSNKLCQTFEYRGYKQIKLDYSSKSFNEGPQTRTLNQRCD